MYLHVHVYLIKNEIDTFILYVYMYMYMSHLATRKYSQKKIVFNAHLGVCGQDTFACIWFFVCAVLADREHSQE